MPGLRRNGTRRPLSNSCACRNPAPRRVRNAHKTNHVKLNSSTLRIYKTHINTQKPKAWETRHRDSTPRHRSKRGRLDIETRHRSLKRIQLYLHACPFSSRTISFHRSEEKIDTTAEQYLFIFLFSRPGFSIKRGFSRKRQHKNLRDKKTQA